MAKQSGSNTRVSKDDQGAPGQPDFAPVVEALAQATQSLASTTSQLLQFTQVFVSGAFVPQGRADAGPAPAAAQISTWEDDPFSEATPTANPAVATPIAVAVPVNGNPRLQTAIAEPRPAPARYNPGTAEFRYWTAAEALARGINFWTPLLPTGTTWSTSNPMRVTLVGGQDLNAFYSRVQGLRFFHQVVQSRDVFSCDSPDVVCHELGHAILDALKPQLFNAASTEAGAFHESLGDMSAVLCALQLESFRQKVLSETAGRLNVNSRLSRVAEQLGWAIRQLSPTAVDRDSLRNAANRFVYRKPNTLPSSAPATLLSSQVHSFSRVFTGAFLDALARMLRVAGTPNDANLLGASRDMGQLLVDGIQAAPITPAYFSQLAAAMVQADQARNSGRYRATLTRSFMDHGILSVSAALELADAPVPQPVSAPSAMTGIAADLGQSVSYQYDDGDADEGYRLGFGETPELPVVTTAPIGRGITFKAHAPEESSRFAVAPAVQGAGDEGIMSAEEAVRSFVEDLVQQGRINVATGKGLLPELAEGSSSRQTHILVNDSDGTLVLKREHFDCRFCGPRLGRSLPSCTEVAF